MTNEERISNIIADIGQLVLNQIGADHADVFFYAEVELGMVAPSLFWDREEKIEYVRTDPALYRKVLDLWNAMSESEKWRGMSYSISGEKFHIEFDYGEDWSEEEMTLDRRGRHVKKRFEGKTIVYPIRPNV